MNNSSRTSDSSQRNNVSVNRKRTINRGLDGGYWSRISVGEMLSDEKPKRQRTVVERLSLSQLNREPDTHMSIESDEDGSRSTVTPKSSKKDEEASSKRVGSAKSDSRFVLFPPKTFLTVRNEEGSFFLCQTTNKIYEDSKRCRILWLEGDNSANSYTFGSGDWIDPLTIISKVNVRKLKPANGREKSDEESTFEIVQDDLDKVLDLLDKAIKDGGITVEFESYDESSESSSSDVSETKPKVVPKKASQILDSDNDFYDKEEEAEEPIRQSKKSKSKKIMSSDSSSEDSDDEKPKKESVKSAKTANAVAKKPKSFEEYKKQLMKKTLDQAAKKASIAEKNEIHKSFGTIKLLPPPPSTNLTPSGMLVKKRIPLFPRVINRCQSLQ